MFALLFLSMIACMEPSNAYLMLLQDSHKTVLGIKSDREDFDLL